MIGSPSDHTIPWQMAVRAVISENWGSATVHSHYQLHKPFLSVTQERFKASKTRCRSPQRLVFLHFVRHTQPEPPLTQKSLQSLNQKHISRIMLNWNTSGKSWQLSQGENSAKKRQGSDTRDHPRQTTLTVWIEQLKPDVALYIMSHVSKAFFLLTSFATFFTFHSELSYKATKF